MALLDRDRDGLEAVAERCARGAEVSAHAVELSDGSAVRTVVAEIVQRTGGIDALVAVAGSVTAGTAEGTTDEVWQSVLGDNATSAFVATREVLPHLRAGGGGAIVLFSSLTALKPMPDRAAYAAAKGAVLALVRQLALEYGPDGISVNAICPGAISTPLLQRRFDAEPRAEHNLKARIPLRRVGEPAEVAALVHLLVGRECRYLTGQTLVIDGGLAIA